MYPAAGGDGFRRVFLDRGLEVRNQGSHRLAEFDERVESLRSDGGGGFESKDGFDLRPALGDGGVHIEEAENVERRRRVLLAFHRHENLREAEEQIRGLARNVREAGLADRSGGREHVVAQDPLAVE